MITAVPGPLIVAPDTWTLVFKHKARRRWLSWLAMGKRKHVAAFAYVPYLHVWLFYDVHLGGTSLTVAATGAHQAVLAAWIEGGASIVTMRRIAQPRTGFGLGFWCVPAIKHLLGLRCGALRPDALWQHCLANGGEAAEEFDGRADEHVVDGLVGCGPVA